MWAHSQWTQQIQFISERLSIPPSLFHVIQLRLIIIMVFIRLIFHNQDVL